MMKIESLRFGDIDFDEEKLIRFPVGLPGFEDCHSFGVVHPEGDSPVLFYLQSTDDPAVSFPITSPDRFGLHYEFSLSDEELALIGLKSADEASVMVLLRRESEATDAPVRAVLTAPLVINLDSRLALQKPLSQVGCDITLRAPL